MFFCHRLNPYPPHSTLRASHLTGAWRGGRFLAVLLIPVVTGLTRTRHNIPVPSGQVSELVHGEEVGS